jgi:hypothetical protein
MRFFSHCREHAEDAQGKIWVGALEMFSGLIAISVLINSLKPRRLDLELDFIPFFTALQEIIEA